MPPKNSPATTPTQDPASTVEDDKQPTGTTPPADSSEDADEEEGEESDAGKKEDDKRTLTKAELANLANRAKGKALSEALKTLGVDSLDAAKEAIEKAKQAELDKLSEKERLEHEAAEAKKKAEAAERELNKLKQTQEKEKAEKSLKDILSAAGVTDDAMDLAMHNVQKFIDDELDDEDEVNADTLKKRLADLRKSKPLWFEVKDVPAGTHPKEKEPPQNPTGQSNKPAKKGEPVFQGKTMAELAKDPAAWAAYKRSKGLA